MDKFLAFFRKVAPSIGKAGGMVTAVVIMVWLLLWFQGREDRRMEQDRQERERLLRILEERAPAAVPTNRGSL